MANDDQIGALLQQYGMAAPESPPSRLGGFASLNNRESSNIEDMRGAGMIDRILATYRHAPGLIADMIQHGIRSVGYGNTPSEAGNARREISDLLPKTETPRLGLHQIPAISYPRRAEGGEVSSSDGLSEALKGLWERRPWKDYATDPPSMLPQLSVAAGLLHPRLGGALRDMSMARGGNGALPPGVGATVSPEARQGIRAIADASPRTLANQMSHDLPAAANTNNRGAVVQMRPSAPSPYRPGSRTAQYEAYLNSLAPDDIPLSWIQFFRGK